MSTQFFDLGAGLNVGATWNKVPPPELRPGMRGVLKVDGTFVAAPDPLRLRDIEIRIGACGLDTVNLRRHGLVMVVDDMGAKRETPINPAATALYHAVCIPGTTWPVRGDVFICPDEDFA